MPPDDGGSVLVLRVWDQAGVPVARVLTRSAGGTGLADIGAVAGVEAIVETVRSWLQRAVGDPARTARDADATEM